MSLPTPGGIPGPEAARDPRTPNLFVIGVPKAGTTFLHHALAKVPSIYMSTVKEPGFFTSTRDQRRGLEYYLDAYFAKTDGHLVRGESTPWYVYSELARRRIAELPAVEPPRFVVMVRRPAERALSMYRDQVRLNRERRSFADAVASELADLDAGRLPDDVRQRYVWCGMYRRHVEGWIREFGADRVHVIVLEELTAAPEPEWAELGRFLGHDLGPARFQEVSERDRNQSGALRWPRLDAFLRSFEGRENPVVEGAKRVLPPGLHRRLLQQVGRLNRTAPLDDTDDGSGQVVGALEGWYRPEVTEFETLLGRPIQAWAAAGSPLAPEDARAAVTAATVGAPAVPTVAPIRILHLVARSHRRGAELVAVELADELERRGHCNRVVALGPSTSGAYEIDLRPLAESRGVGLPELVSRVRRVRRLLAEEHFDVVLAHGGWAAQVAALATPRAGPLLVWQRILGFPPTVWQPGRRWWWQVIARRFDVGVALTPDLEDELRLLGFQGPVWIIPNSRKPDRFLDLDREVTTAHLREELGVAEGVPLIGFVGHLVPQKRPDRLLDVLAHLFELGQPAHLVVTGDGALRDDLVREAQRRGLASSMSFLGYRPDVELVLGGVELALITSDAEGIPGVAIEALMAGCPVVSYPAGGIGEVVDHGMTGIVLARPDAALMAEEVAALLVDEPRRAAMSAAGRLQTARLSASVTAEIYGDRLAALITRS